MWPACVLHSEYDPCVIVERMLIGDLSYDENGLMDRTHHGSFRRVRYSSYFWIAAGSQIYKINITVAT